MILHRSLLFIAIAMNNIHIKDDKFPAHLYETKINCYVCVLYIQLYTRIYGTARFELDTRVRCTRE